MTFEQATQLSEVKALQKLNNHPNLIKIIELTKKDQNVYVIFEYCDRNLLQEMKDRANKNQQYSEQEVKDIMQ